MPLISYSASDFPNGYPATLTGEHSLTISWSQLIWAAITVGRAEWQHVVQHGIYSAYEMLYRIAIVYANLQEKSNRRLKKSPAYIGLDGSEKGAVSYFLGLALSKLFAEQLLGVPWLMHLDVYRQQLAVQLSGNSRPDLLGLDQNGGWVIIESKGRTGGCDSAVLAKAKEQAGLPTSIGGATPVLSLGSVAHFSSGVLQLSVTDPPPNEKQHRRIAIDVTPVSFQRRYYSPVRSFLDEAGATTRRIGRNEFVMASLPGMDIAVGVRSDLREDNDTGITLDPEWSRNAHGQVEDVFVGQDGIVVQAGALWSSENMQLAPWERHP